MYSIKLILPMGKLDKLKPSIVLAIILRVLNYGEE